MEHDPKTGEFTATIGEAAVYTTLLFQALFEILEEKGLVSGAEVSERRRRLQKETSVRMWAAQSRTLVTPKPNQMAGKEESISDIMACGIFLAEALYETLADKGLMTKAEVIARIRKLKTEIRINQGPKN